MKEEAIRILKRSKEIIERGEELAPVLILRNNDPRKKNQVIPIFNYFENDAAKNRLTFLVSSFLRNHQEYESYFIISEVWTLKMEKTADMEGKSKEELREMSRVELDKYGGEVSTHPARTEAIMINGRSRSGESLMILCPFERDESSSVTFGDHEIMDTSHGFEGRFANFFEG